MSNERRLLIQSDFDGTVTTDDASFLILSEYLPDVWEPLFEKYQQGAMTLGAFNALVFSKIRTGKQELLNLIDGRIGIREGFPEFMQFCLEQDIPVVFVSNGLDFYIKFLLEKAGYGHLPYHSGITEFTPDGMAVHHEGPDGTPIDADVKAAFTAHYRSQGYDVIYLGDGHSDIYPARKAQHVFATGPLISYCREENLACTPFENFHEVIQTMESLV